MARVPKGLPEAIEIRLGEQEGLSFLTEYAYEIRMAGTSLFFLNTIPQGNGQMMTYMNVPPKCN